MPGFGKSGYVPTASFINFNFCAFSILGNYKYTILYNNCNLNNNKVDLIFKELVNQLNL